MADARSSLKRAFERELAGSSLPPAAHREMVRAAAAQSESEGPSRWQQPFLAAAAVVITLAVVLTIVLGRPSPTVLGPAVSQTPVPGPSAAASQPALVIPTPQGTFRRCEVSQLEGRLISIGAATGNVRGTIELRNRSAVECDLFGYPGIQLLDTAGKPLATSVEWTTTTFFPPDTFPTVVALPPGTDPITTDRPVAGHAYIDLAWDDVLSPCETPSRLKVTPPDSSQSIVVSATPRGGTPGQMTICSRGSLRVKPVRPAANP